ncbi:hypothetical protein FIU94_08840 [Sulfitobacter sp. THAF37]|uniref:TniB family NTP-binding protein n=1 Tax=Sulfitobacter sp. THAF37 TaxID=2587855 RepID=UPI0012685DA8|nr:TniB family NTP-binding protein [Sulfitobacter sp. THAF37]QFT58930.1 hypothetical protein FIU94_08840 [Sulfitobacter sp. THAF37]
MTTSELQDRGMIREIVAGMRSKYITLERDRKIRERLDRLLSMDANGNSLIAADDSRADGERRGLAVVGGAGSGKTSLINKAVDNHPDLQPSSAAPIPVVRVTVPNPATSKSLAFEVLKKTGYTELAKKRATAWDAWNDVRVRFKLLGTVLLVIDEAQDMFPRGSKSEAHDILRTLKTLMQDEGGVAVVLCGIETLFERLSVDFQADRRFKKFELGPVNVTADGKLLRGLVSTYCDMAEVARPEPADLIERLAHAGRYRLGLCIEQIIAAIEIALMRGDKTLEIQHFAEAFFEQEACEVGRNVFLSPRWSKIDLG